MLVELKCRCTGCEIVAGQIYLPPFAELVKIEAPCSAACDELSSAEEVRIRFASGYAGSGYELLDSGDSWWAGRGSDCWLPTAPSSESLGSVPA